MNVKPETLRVRTMLTVKTQQVLTNVIAEKDMPRLTPTMQKFAKVRLTSLCYYQKTTTSARFP